MKNSYLHQIAIALLTGSLSFASNAADAPKMADKAPDFVLQILDDQTIHLSDLTRKAAWSW